MTLKIIDSIGNSNISKVYFAKTLQGKYLEFAESWDHKDNRWVLIISTLFGCPVNCSICDAGSFFEGKISKDELLSQIDYLVNLRYSKSKINCNEFKIQFARMGEPTLNSAVLDVLYEISNRYNCDCLLPSFSTIAPKGCDDFLAKLIEIKNKLYPNGKFQMQFSLHTTDKNLRDVLIPINKWSFFEIAEYGKRFHSSGDKKIGLNFALAKDSPICVDELKRYFSPELFIIKITPVNPTVSSEANNITSYFTKGEVGEDSSKLVSSLEMAGYEVIVSIGDLAENKIGSNCGQYVKRYLDKNQARLPQDAYCYANKKI